MNRPQGDKDRTYLLGSNFNNPSKGERNKRAREKGQNSEVDVEDRTS